MTEMPKRKHIRLRTFDYSSSGMYFLTICTHNKQCLFSEVVGAIHESPADAPPPVGAIHESPAQLPFRCVLTEYGKTVDVMLRMLPLQFENVSISDYIIMPNHVHLIVELSDVEGLRAIHESPLRANAESKRSGLSKIVGFFKMQVSKRIHEIDPSVTVWQRGYYDHVIRDYEDYKTKAEYIATNPLRWVHHRAGEAYR